jgi:hypothetical protein
MLLASLLLSASLSGAQTIGVFSDSAGTDCSLSIPYPGPPVTTYVIGTLEGDSAAGIILAAFGIDGLPAGWIATVTDVDPDATVTVGNVFEQGIQLAYPTCTSGRRTLLRLSILPTSAAENVTLHIVPHAQYAGCGFEGRACSVEPCANFCGCGDIAIDCYCAQEVPGVINGPPCVVATAAETWGRVKRWYR